MNVDQPGAISMPVPDRITFSSTDATWLVIHKTAGFRSAQDVAAYFQSGSGGRDASVHYIVGLDGTIVQCVPESRGAGGNCCLAPGHASYLPTGINLNLKTISVEHVDPSIDNSTPVPHAQKVASFRLIHDICKRHNIPMRQGDGSGGIIGHHDIDPVNRARCPGNYPWQEMLASLENGGITMLDIHNGTLLNFFDLEPDGSLKCKSTGHVVQKGILGFYLRYGGDALCGLTYLGLPLSNETGVSGKQNCVTQQFERGLLAWDPQHQLDFPPSAGDVYVLHQPQFAAQPVTPAPVAAPDPSAQHLRDVLAQIEQLAKV